MPWESSASARPTGEAITKLARHFPFLAYAQELARLANVVEEHSRTGRVSLQTLSQLAAMEEIIGLIRSSGLAVLATSAISINQSEQDLENRVGYI